jgi:hypothetical protein
MHRGDGDLRALGQLADVPSPARLQEQGVEHLGATAPVDAPQDAWPTGPLRLVYPVIGPGQVDVDAAARIVIANAMLPEQRAARLGDSRGDEHRHVGHGLIETT